MLEVLKVSNGSKVSQNSHFKQLSRTSKFCLGLVLVVVATLGAMAQPFSLKPIHT